MSARQATSGRRAIGDAHVVLRRLDLTLCLLLLIQFVLGMIVNLFVPIPSKHPGAHPAGYLSGIADSIGWAVPDGGVWLAAHVALGLAMVLASIAGLIAAVRYGQRGPIAAALVGLLAIIGAAFNGASFLSFNKDYSSMIMAGCFALALACYIVGLDQINTQRHPRHPA
ncbi:hypothetical protein CLV47_101422 [Antricoccus suffuscus]|uniref:Uncharacterized protein n=1 Tax=Antricoccus suffuscus TaxID=1629062 RepID=A0A2T1A6S5_9ACTN|nr:hypothetical protein [Antricoccus suffuscus]PRZ44296.1 hypothetical protein CLV47_101422 [Antricoccus suffuscus]